MGTMAPVDLSNDDPSDMSAALAAAEAEDADFFRRYGVWARTTPTAAAALLDGIEAPWWIAGGWALEAFSGVAREHDDVDVAYFARDLPAVRRQFERTHHLWAVGFGAMRPVNDRFPRQPRWARQVWVREHALAPWLLDLVTTQGRVSAWTFRHDTSYVRPLAEATWLAADGLRYLAPELVLAYKARLDRPKDRGDFDAAWPLLDAEQRRWLVNTVQRLFPTCSWLPTMGR